VRLGELRLLRDQAIVLDMAGALPERVQSGCQGPVVESEVLGVIAGLVHRQGSSPVPLRRIVVTYESMPNPMNKNQPG
jgi:hypothetical protein